MQFYGYKYNSNNMKEVSGEIVKMISRTKFNVEDGTITVPSTIFQFNSEQKLCPLVIIINGHGGSGKGSLISGISDAFTVGNTVELSAVDPIYDPVHLLLHSINDNLQDVIDIYAKPDKADWRCADDICSERPDSWRGLMAGVKEALDTYFPKATTRYLEGQVIKNLNLGVDLIFVNIREKENIELFQKSMWEAGIPCVTMLVERPAIDHRYGNLADDEVNSIKYDIRIVNDSDLEALRAKAYSVAMLLRIGMMHGANLIKDLNDGAPLNMMEPETLEYQGNVEPKDDTMTV